MSSDMVRIDASFKGIKTQALAEYFVNPPPGQQAMIKEMRTIEQVDADTKIVYWRFKMPMMSDRDNVISLHQRNNDDGSIYFCLKTVERADVPEVPGCVRMFLYTRGIAKPNAESPEDIIDYTEFSYFNMKGYFPARLMNMVIASETQKEFGNMYKYLIS